MIRLEGPRVQGRGPRLSALLLAALWGLAGCREEPTGELPAIPVTETPPGPLAVEQSGTPARALAALATATEGTFGVVHDGTLLTGRAAEERTDPKYD